MLISFTVFEKKTLNVSGTSRLYEKFYHLLQELCCLKTMKSIQEGLLGFLKQVVPFTNFFKL